MTLRYLLDTCVVSEFVKPRPAASVVGWLRSIEVDRAFLSVVTLGEVQMGISQRPASNRRTELEVWLSDGLLSQFGDRLLALDSDTMLTWGRLVAQQRQRGEPMGIMDSLIAATAIQHQMVLVTRSVADFRSTGISSLNPREP